MVCKPDVATRTIAFALSFCGLRPLGAQVDSMLSTLIHEVTHFDDCFGSLDTYYGLQKSHDLAPKDPAQAKLNADSIAGYVVWMEVFYAA